MFRKWSYEANRLALKKSSEAITIKPFDVDVQIQLSKLHHDQQISDNFAAWGAEIKAHLHWLKVGDKALKEFYQGLVPVIPMLGLKRLNKEMLFYLVSLPFYKNFFITMRTCLLRMGIWFLRRKVSECVFLLLQTAVVDQCAFCEKLLSL